MYSTCLFCNAGLGSNEELEIFPVGKRLAYDAARGRLWVVCRSCERWNLSPLEERWEAIEHCESRYSLTRLRVSTDNIGLAKLKSGLELVRIGAPQRPELAAWRYGDQFGRRRRRMIVRAGAGIGLLGVAVGGGIAAGLSIAAFGGGLSQITQRIISGSPRAVVARIPDHGRVIEVRRKQLESVRLMSSDEDEFMITVPLKRDDYIVMSGEAGRRAASVLLPAINQFGGSRKNVARAVSELEHHGDAETFLAQAARVSGVRDPVRIASRPAYTRLAIEMALHEETERRALEGELAMLEAAWRDAEQIAAISDDLLVPASLTERLGRLRRRD